MKKLPIGISTLAKIIVENCVYVDKTKHVANLANSGTYYFLSRPRRFGKSLLIDTLKQAFLANKEIFTGLYLEHNWDWNIKHPVIHIDFGNGVVQSSDALNVKINTLLNENYEKYQIENRYTEVGDRFSYLIDELATKYQQKVVVLIDEYDKPILDNITETQTAAEIREGLKNLYSVIKAQDVNLRFVMLTGVSKFSKVSLFSGLNNLNDISLNEKYADICGYTQADLEREFADYLIEGNVDKVKLKYWYNGYNFAGTTERSVYNPFDILLFCSNGYNYKNYWFETGTPTFLIKLIKANRYFIPNIESVVISGNSISSFDVDNIELVSLLFQTGYLTISEKLINPFSDLVSYRLNYPNFEVRNSLNECLLNYFVTDKQQLSLSYSRLLDALLALNFEWLKEALCSLFASIPYNWYVNNDIANYEGFYATVIYSWLNSSGVAARAEDVTNKGRIDLSIELPNAVLILEFKLHNLGDAASCIQQIKDRKYAEKFQAKNKPIHLIGISFNTEDRNIADFAWESV